jgi:hypothetical protein
LYEPSISNEWFRVVVFAHAICRREGGSSSIRAYGVIFYYMDMAELKFALSSKKLALLFMIYLSWSITAWRDEIKILGGTSAKLQILLIKKKEYVIQTRYTWTRKTRNRKPTFYFLYSTAFPQPGMI